MLSVPVVRTPGPDARSISFEEQRETAVPWHYVRTNPKTGALPATRDLDPTNSSAICFRTIQLQDKQILPDPAVPCSRSSYFFFFLLHPLPLYQHPLSLSVPYALWVLWSTGRRTNKKEVIECKGKGIKRPSIGGYRLSIKKTGNKKNTTSNVKIRGISPS